MDRVHRINEEKKKLFHDCKYSRSEYSTFEPIVL